MIKKITIGVFILALFIAKENSRTNAQTVATRCDCVTSITQICASWIQYPYIFSSIAVWGNPVSKTSCSGFVYSVTSSGGSWGNAYRAEGDSGYAPDMSDPLSSNIGYDTGVVCSYNGGSQIGTLHYVGGVLYAIPTTGVAPRSLSYSCYPTVASLPAVQPPVVKIEFK
jgi:hypothetical protein